MCFEGSAAEGDHLGVLALLCHSVRHLRGYGVGVDDVAWLLLVGFI